MTRMSAKTFIDSIACRGLAVIRLCSLGSCRQQAARHRKFICYVKAPGDRLEYRAYLLAGVQAYDDGIQITALNKGEKILKVYEGFRYCAMQLDPGRKLIVHLHDGKKMKGVDTIRLK